MFHYQRNKEWPILTKCCQILNLGNSDWESFSTQGYEESIWDLSLIFEDAYVSLIRAIRTKAYPKNPMATSDSLPNPKKSNPVPTASSDVPIFVMRPLRGQLEGATHAVVDRLRNEGDNVFWVDTSGWLDLQIDFGGSTDRQDFLLNGRCHCPHQFLSMKPNV